MAIYLISGKLGSGKTLSSVGVIREALLSGRKVATNLDLHLDKLLPSSRGRPRRSDGTSAVHQPVQAVRIPDKPGVEDLELLGSGNDSMDETKNGVIVLDELAAWLNSRTFNDKSRAPVIDWLIHSRKFGWDVYFICQHIEQIDKQVRTSLVEYLVTCRRLDRIKIPFIGKLIQSLSAGYLSGNLPKIHVAVVKYGTEQHAPIADRWIYQAKDLHAAYNTRQVFTDSYASGTYSYLTPWHLEGWKIRCWRDKLAAWWNYTPPLPKLPPKPKHALAEELAGLCEREALHHWRKLDQLGAFEEHAPALDRLIQHHRKEVGVSVIAG